LPIIIGFIALSRIELDNMLIGDMIIIATFLFPAMVAFHYMVLCRGERR
jgi:hypothetical protein